MRVEHFEIYITELKFCILFSRSRILSRKIIKFYQLIWKFQNSAKLSTKGIPITGHEGLRRM